VQGRNGGGGYFHASTVLAVRAFNDVFGSRDFLRDLSLE
jgi:hypothetical protein